MKITALLENTTQRDGMETEHGLSLYIETKKHRILFDMGQSDLFAKNAEKLGIDLSKVDLAVLSHGHYDHGGGLKRFLELNPTAPVYVSRHAFGSHRNGSGKDIGLDVSLLHHPRLRLTEGDTVLAPDLSLHHQNHLPRPNSLGAFGLKRVVDGIATDDEFYHEQYLLIREGEKTVLISGCSHKGIVDITGWFTPTVLVGGFHLSKLPCGEELDGVITQLNRFPTLFYTCHCTGGEQYKYMKEKMPRLEYLSTGAIVNLFDD